MENFIMILILWEIDFTFCTFNYTLRDIHGTVTYFNASMEYFRDKFTIQ